MFAIIAGVAGIISTILAWNLNPKRKLYAELDDIYKKLDRLYEERDAALVARDSDTLSRVTADIIRLSARRRDLFQRLK